MPKIIDDELKPYWSTTDGEYVRIFHGDVLETLRKMPSQSVHCAVTSPPYWGLRDYSTATWEGGNDPKCSHDAARKKGRGDYGFSEATAERFHKQFSNDAAGFASYKNQCPTCGAKKVDHQLGSERIPDCLGWARGENCAEKDWGSACHVCRMVLVFRELRRVLRDDGVLWVNYGDTYAAGSTDRLFMPDFDKRENEKGERWSANRKGKGISGARSGAGPKTGMKSGNLVGVPWRVALALQADGWVLRSDIIWHKVSAMPESVRNRCSKAHEYVFMFAKKMGYYYDSEAVKEKTERTYVWEMDGNSHYKNSVGDASSNPKKEGRTDTVIDEQGARNKRSVWSLASRGYEGAHFATFPVALIEPMILAGTSERGACASCGSPWKRILETNYIPHGENAKSQRKTNGANSKRDDDPSHQTAGNIRPQEMKHGRATREDKTIGWRPSCECYGNIVKRKVKTLGYGDWRTDKKGELVQDQDQGLRGANYYENYGNPTKEVETTIEEYVSDLPLEDHPITPCTVLDPFLGSGTTCCVAIAHGRRSVGIELSETYIKENAIKRVEGALMDRPQLAALAGRKIEKIKSKGSLLK